MGIILYCYHRCNRDLVISGCQASVGDLLSASTIVAVPCPGVSFYTRNGIGLTIIKFYRKSAASVVNWFQIMFLFLVRQRFCSVFLVVLCCELISNYVLIFGSTTCWWFTYSWSMLWIDFKLCSYFWFDNKAWRYKKSYRVVNWFQIMFLFLVRQRHFLWICTASGLWIDFKLCSYFWFDNLIRRNNKI